jgi:hypothetical protein
VLRKHKKKTSRPERKIVEERKKKKKTEGKQLKIEGLKFTAKLQKQKKINYQ